MGVLGGNLDYADFPRLNSVAYGLVMQELERGDSGLRSFVSVQGALVMYPIWRYGSDEQKARWLPAMHAGKADRLLRAHRARPRQRPGRHGDEGRQATGPATC